MDLYLAANEISEGLQGKSATAEDIEALRSFFPRNLMPDWLVDLLTDFRLGGEYFSLSPEEDQSTLGADIIWLRPDQIISESRDTEPGISILSSGFIPVGSCAQGSGDPYFLDMRQGLTNPPLVRVAHDYARVNKYPIEKVELVLPRLADLFVLAKPKIAG